MIHRLTQLLYQLQIKALTLFSPVTLFQKLSMQSWYSETLHEWLVPHINGKQLRILDVGCASGYLSEYLYQYGHTVAGLDSSKSMIKTAKRRIPEIDFKLGNACNLPYANDTFDFVLSASLINIITDPSALVEQMVRACKTGGWITLLFPVSGFNDNNLNTSISTLRISGFSKAAMVTWHKSAPKISIEYVMDLLKRNKLHLSEPNYYLHGMIASISARKDFDSNDMD